MSIHRRLSNRIVILFNWFLVYCLTTTPLVLYAQTISVNTENSSNRSLVQPAGTNKVDFKKLLSEIETFRASSPAGPSELESWLQPTKQDLAKMFQLVRQSTRLVPYRGMLRGSQGVRMDRQGNSLDRTLLLAELVQTTGKEIRLCQTSLAPETIRLLAAQLKEQKTPPLNSISHEFAKNRNERFIKNHSSIVGASKSRLTLQPFEQSIEKSIQRSRRQTQTIEKLVASEVAFDKTPNGEFECLKDHWWLQINNDGKWVDYDLCDIVSEQKLTPSNVYNVKKNANAEQAVPATEKHTIQLRVVIEQWSEKKLQRHVALEHQWVPAETIGQPMTLYHAPRKWPKALELPKEERLQSLRHPVTQQKEWVPILAIGQQSVMQKAFDDRGYLIEEAVPSTFGGLGQALGKPTQAPGILVAEKIEYSIQVPGQEKRIETRDVFNLLGNAVRSDQKQPEWDADKQNRRALALTESIEIFSQVCSLDPNWAEDQILQSLIINQSLLVTALTDESTMSSKLRGEIKGFESMPGDAMRLAMDRSLAINQQADLFIGSPNILTCHRRLKEKDDHIKLCTGLDIVFNQVHSLSPADAANAILRQGILDTHLEADILRPCSKIDNAAEIFETSFQNQEWKVYRTKKALESIDVSIDLREKMGASIDSGFAVLAPSKLVDFSGEKSFAWWRINLRTGETLGMGKHGWGQAMTERTLLMSSVSKRGEGLLEYMIVLSLIMICGIVAFVRYIAHSTAVTLAIQEALYELPICEVSRGEVEKRLQPSPRKKDNSKR